MSGSSSHSPLSSTKPHTSFLHTSVTPSVSVFPFSLPRYVYIQHSNTAQWHDSTPQPGELIDSSPAPLSLPLIYPLLHHCIPTRSCVIFPSHISSNSTLLHAKMTTRMDPIGHHYILNHSQSYSVQLSRRQWLNASTKMYPTGPGATTNSIQTVVHALQATH